MAATDQQYAELDALVDQVIDVASGDMKPFLVPRHDHAANHRTLDEFAYAYGEAFQLLYLELRGGRAVLMPPILLLFRHSIELAIKSALSAYSKYGGSAKAVSHDLSKLWAKLLTALQNAGFDIDDDYSRACSEIIDHIHQHDTWGDRFRYPAARDGSLFPSTEIELDEIYKRHWQVTTYCEASIEMLNNYAP